MLLRTLFKLPSVSYAYLVLRKAQKDLNQNGAAWLESYMTCASDIEPSTRASTSGQRDQSLALHWHESVRLAARLPLWQAGKAPACLPKSIALLGILRARGLSSVLRLGISKQGQGLRSHAWVEVGGKMIGEPISVANDFVPVRAKAWPYATQDNLIDSAAKIR